MKKTKNEIIKMLISITMVVAMVVAILPINVFANDTISLDNTNSKEGGNGGVTNHNLRSVASSLAEVYVDSVNGYDWNDGQSTSTAVRSLKEAVNLVQSGGTIYCLNLIELKTDLILDGKGATLTYASGSNFRDSLLKIQENANISITNLIIDGGNIEAYIYDMVYIDKGVLTLGEGTVIQNAANNDYGAALGIYDEATVNLNGTKIINNRSGLSSVAHVGGVTVSGTLNVNDGTIITGNQLFNPATPIDVLLTSSGKINLSGNTKIGTIAFASKPTTPQIAVSSALQNPMNVRMQSYFNNSILLPDFSVGNILADGKDGYTLSNADIGKFTLASPNLYIVKLNVKMQAYVAAKPFKVIVNDKMVGGTVNVDKKEAILNEKVIISPQASPGYKYKSNSLRVYEEGHENSTIYIAKDAENKQYFNMTKQNAVVDAKFDKIPATVPIITANLPTEKNLSEADKLKLTVKVQESVEDILSFQWYKGSQIITGQTSDTLIIENVGLSDAGDYHVQVLHTTAAGESATVNSNTCAVAIIKNPNDMIFKTNIETTKKLNEKETLELKVSVIGGNGVLTYQWYKNGVEIVGETTPTLKITGVRKEDTGAYSIKVYNTNANGKRKTANSNDCKVIVVNLPSDITLLANLDASQTSVEGEPFELKVKTQAVSEGVLTYQWYKDGIAIPGAINNSYKEGKASKKSEGIYYVKVTNTNSLGIKKEVISNDCLLKVARKKIEVDSSAAINGQVKNQDELWDAALSTSEKDDYKNKGMDAFVYLKMASLNFSGDEQYIYSKLGNKKMGNQLDISVFKKMGDLTETAIKELSQEISITMDIPENLRSNQGENRRYYIIRVHHDENGRIQTDILNDLDTDIHTITFKTKLFSTYALVYDVDTSINKPNSPNSNGADTGDVDYILVYMFSCFISFIILGFVVYKRTNRNRI